MNEKRGTCWVGYQQIGGNKNQNRPWLLYSATGATGATGPTGPAGPMANAGALETALEGGGGAGIITTNGALAANDAFIIQYQNSNTSTYSYAIANVESAVNASSIVNNWEVTDIASTDFAQAFSETQFSFIA